jgi:hypothetical protein
VRVITAPCATNGSTVKGIGLHIVEVGHSFVDAMPYQPGSSAQRIRIGLTSLAFVFLIVLIASVITRAGRDETNATQQATANEPSEPLAELGVAPGASGEEANNTAVANKK